MQHRSAAFAVLVISLLLVTYASAQHNAHGKAMVDRLKKARNKETPYTQPQPKRHGQGEQPPSPQPSQYTAPEGATTADKADVVTNPAVPHHQAQPPAAHIEPPVHATGESDAQARAHETHVEDPPTVVEPHLSVAEHHEAVELPAAELKATRPARSLAATNDQPVDSAGQDQENQEHPAEHQEQQAAEHSAEHQEPQAAEHPAEHPAEHQEPHAAEHQEQQAADQEPQAADQEQQAAEHQEPQAAEHQEPQAAEHQEPQAAEHQEQQAAAEHPAEHQEQQAAEHQEPQAAQQAAEHQEPQAAQQAAEHKDQQAAEEEQQEPQQQAAEQQEAVPSQEENAVPDVVPSPELAPPQQQQHEAPAKAAPVNPQQHSRSRRNVNIDKKMHPEHARAERRNPFLQKDASSDDKMRFGQMLRLNKARGRATQMTGTARSLLEVINHATADTQALPPHEPTEPLPADPAIAEMGLLELEQYLRRLETTLSHLSTYCQEAAKALHSVRDEKAREDSERQAQLEQEAHERAERERRDNEEREAQRERERVELQLEKERLQAQASHHTQQVESANRARHRAEQELEGTKRGQGSDRDSKSGGGVSAVEAVMYGAAGLGAALTLGFGIFFIVQRRNRRKSRSAAKAAKDGGGLMPFSDTPVASPIAPPPMMGFQAPPPMGAGGDGGMKLRNRALARFEDNA